MIEVKLLSDIDVVQTKKQFPIEINNEKFSIEKYSMITNHHETELLKRMK